VNAPRGAHRSRHGSAPLGIGIEPCESAARQEGAKRKMVGLVAGTLAAVIRARTLERKSDDFRYEP